MTIQAKDPNIFKVFMIKRINDEEGTKIAKHMIKYFGKTAFLLSP